MTSTTTARSLRRVAETPAPTRAALEFAGAASFDSHEGGLVLERDLRFGHGHVIIALRREAIRVIEIDPSGIGVLVEVVVIHREIVELG